MNQVRICSTIFLGIMVLCGGAVGADRLNRLKTTYGSSDRVCVEVGRMIAKMPAADFWDGGWPRSFGGHKWIEDVWPAIGTTGEHFDIRFKYSYGDLFKQGGHGSG
ncbi:MAG: hypothetical protein IPG93_15075 [Burkholderiales bacterium]|nr:hypothetical protein [Burkholderiales bacterium]